MTVGKKSSSLICSSNVCVYEYIGKFFWVHTSKYLIWDVQKVFNSYIIINLVVEYVRYLFEKISRDIARMDENFVPKVIEQQNYKYQDHSFLL